MPGPDLSHREATGVGVGMEHAHEVRDSRTALYRIGILGLGIWSIVAFVGGPGESPVSAEEATSRIAAVCDDIDVAEANALLALGIDEMKVLSPRTVIAEIEDGIDDLDRLTDIIDIAAGSELYWSASAKSQLSLYEFSRDFFRTVRNGLNRGKVLSDLADEIGDLGDSRVITRESFEGVQDGLGSIDRCASVVTLLPSWN